MANELGAGTKNVETLRTEVGLDRFAHAQFDDPHYNGTRILPDKCDKHRFLNEVNKIIMSHGVSLRPGYAPFCKHIFIPDFTGAKISVLRINDSNEHMLKTGYIARRPEELPVLSRWFEQKDVGQFLNAAKFLDIILYSKEQIAKEKEAMGGNVGPVDVENHPPWSIIAIKAQDEDYELPMAPITAMRNGIISQGGSGVPIEKGAYMKSVAYWQSHANVVNSVWDCNEANRGMN